MRACLLLVALQSPLPLSAVPPPPEQVTANCDAPTYASDVLVCEDEELRRLDRRLADLIAQRNAAAGGRASQESDQDWFRRSRRCAFDDTHRDCLVAAYRDRIELLAGPARRDQAPGPYRAVSWISRAGFARNREDVRPLHGQTIRIWGYVDHGNLYGDGSVKRLLGDRWSGYGPNAATWRFNLKAHADDAVGQSFPVHIPNDEGRDALLAVFLADARAHRPTRVYLEGTLVTFEAPTNVGHRTGLQMELRSSRDVQLRLPVERTSTSGTGTGDTGRPRKRDRSWKKR